MSLERHWLGRVSYARGLELQDSAVRRRLAGEGGDAIYLLEHEPVYTIGRTRDRSSLRGGEADLPHPVFETNRGGQATYHGPGQLVGYPIVDLSGYVKDLHAYLRALEESLVAACAEVGVEAGRREGLTGVWCGGRKLASIGVGVRQWVTMHGFAINVAPDLSGFDAITPCGISGVEMTSLGREAGREIDLRAFADVAADCLEAALGRMVGG